MYLKKYNLRNKYAFVTGAGKGLGKACAIALAEAGCNLIIVSRTKKDLDDVSKISKKLKVKCKSYTCDVTNYNEIKTIINKRELIFWLIMLEIISLNTLQKLKQKIWNTLLRLIL